MAALSAKDLGLVYGAGAGATVALERLDLSVAAGDPVAIIGPSGCGKSSLLLAAAGLVAPTSGTLEVGGEHVGGPRRRTALILQDFGLLPWKTVRANAELGLTIRRVSAADRGRTGAEAIASVGLTEFADRYPVELSGGMRQRVALARALALDADLLLMDEPLSALDALTREDLQDLLLALWHQRGHTQVLVTHSIEEAVFLGRRVIVMSPRPGRVASVVDNPDMGAEGYRQSERFFERTAELRRLLAAEGALRGTGQGPASDSPARAAGEASP
jgi:ABC-type nitrate/sulfonate/bicarbonate transport system ATPase subunit